MYSLTYTDIAKMILTRSSNWLQLNLSQVTSEHKKILLKTKIDEILRGVDSVKRTTRVKSYAHDADAAARGDKKSNALKENSLGIYERSIRV